MRAIVINQFGGPDVLQPTELDTPEPGPGEVLVRVMYSAVNPADWKTREGMLERHIQYHFPFVLGFDLAGTVAATGPGVTEFAPGDRVYGTSRQGQGMNGSYAEYTIAASAMLIPAPPHLSLADVAGLPTAGTTAYGGLVDAGEMKPGQTVLIHGGGGSVGTYAIQIARQFGARIAATCSARKRDYVSALGADCIIDYRADNVAESVQRWCPGGVDLVLDAVGLGTLLPSATHIVKPGGRYIEVETLISEAGADDKARAAERSFTIRSNMAAIHRLPAHLKELAALAAAGKVTPQPYEILPLASASEAHWQVQNGTAKGKLLLDIAAF